MSSITLENVLEMDLKSILAAVKDPATSKEMQTLLRDRKVAARVSELMLEAQNREAEVDAQLNRVVPPSTEALAEEAQAMAAEPVVEVAPPVVPVVEAVVTATDAEDAEWKAVGVTVHRDANGKPTRYVEEYQVVGEDGKAIGRPTHLEARTLPELAAKKREVHTQATRAFHRLKQQKLTFKQEPKTVLTPEAIAEAARLALEEKNPAKVTEVIREVIESEYGKKEQELRAAEWQQQGKAISNEFQRRHLHDYSPCDANKKAIADYFVEKNLEFTLDNLEAAFVDLMEDNKLVKVESAFQKPAIVSANPEPVATVAEAAAPVIPVVAQPAAVPASAAPAQPAAPSQPVVEATVSTPAAAPNGQPAARRPGANGGLVPGTMSAHRPEAQDPQLARKQFLKTVRDMDPKVMKNKLKTDPQFVKQLESYGIRVK
jgi:hypothetical protein